MAELELTRTRDDRRLYTLGDIGTLRLQGLVLRGATAEANDSTWRIARRGFWQRRIEATDETGVVVGEFEPHSLRRGGRLSWRGRELTLRPASSWRERYALADGDRELAVMDGKTWGGRRPVKVTVDDAEAVEPGLLLFAAFIVRGLAEHAGGAEAGGATTAATSGGQ